MQQATRTIPTGSALRDAITHVPFMPRWESRFTMIVPQALSHLAGISADTTGLVRLMTREHREQAPGLTSRHKPQGDACAHWIGCAEESRSCMAQRSRLMGSSAQQTQVSDLPLMARESRIREPRSAMARAQSRGTLWRGHHCTKKQHLESSRMWWLWQGTGGEPEIRHCIIARLSPVPLFSRLMPSLVTQVGTSRRSDMYSNPHRI